MWPLLGFSELMRMAGDPDCPQRSDAIGELINRHAGWLRVAAEKRGLQLTNAAWGASDVAQDILLRVFQSFGRFRGESEDEFRRWVTGIFRKAALQRIRDTWAPKRSPARQAFPMGIDGSGPAWSAIPASKEPPPERVAEQAELRRRLAEALETLGDDQRIAVCLCRFEGWSYADIAACMDKSVKAVTGLIYRGTLTLKSALRNMGVNSDG